jgi:hypothetical protein
VDNRLARCPGLERARVVVFVGFPVVLFRLEREFGAGLVEDDPREAEVDPGCPNEGKGVDLGEKASEHEREVPVRGRGRRRFEGGQRAGRPAGAVLSEPFCGLVSLDREVSHDQLILLF